MVSPMRRRDLILGLCGAALVWDLATRVEQRATPVILSAADQPGIMSRMWPHSARD